MSDLIPFDFDSHPIRVLLKDGNPWFCLVDVCRALDLDRSSDLIRSLDKQGWVSNPGLTVKGIPMIFIHEPNLYRLIFRSDKPEARRFQDWVFNEVLPAIRKTGEYRIDGVGAVREPPLQADLESLRAQLAACHRELLQVKPLWGKVVRYKKLGLNHVEIGLLTVRDRRNVRRNVRRIEACGLLPARESMQLSLLGG